MSVAMDIVMEPEDLYGFEHMKMSREVPRVVDVLRVVESTDNASDSRNRG